MEAEAPGPGLGPDPVNNILVPALIFRLMWRLRRIGPGDPGALGSTIRDYITTDPDEIVGITAEQITEEVVPELRDTVFGGAGDLRYQRFVRDHLEPLGIDGRLTDTRVAGRMEEVPLF